MKALIVVDIQNGVFSWDGTKVHGGDSLVSIVNALVASARAGGTPVVFVQHEDEWLVAGSDLFALVGDLDVRPSADVFIVKRHGSAFHDTSLEEQLRSAGVDEVVVCGLQTEFCVDSTVRHAHTLGFAVTLVSDAHSTYDSKALLASQIIDHHNRALANYATVSRADVLTRPDRVRE